MEVTVSRVGGRLQGGEFARGGEGTTAITRAHGCTTPNRGVLGGVSAPRQVFEQLLQEMVYRERSCRWYLVGSEVLPFPLIGSG